MMEESSDEESISIKFVSRPKNNEPDWKKLHSSVNEFLFKTYSGKPISFHVCVSEFSVKKKYEELICKFGGSTVKCYSDIVDRTALLVKNNSRFSASRPFFKLSYVIDCIMRNALLNINGYVHSMYLGRNKDFMKILFWEEVLEKDIVDRYDGSSDECNTMSYCSSSVSINHKKLGKNTRELYTRNEKEAILNFIISKGKLDGLRGDPIWKLMERKGVCPRRTYQSMKNHFLKKLVFELDNFDFLSETEKCKIRKTY